MSNNSSWFSPQRVISAMKMACRGVVTVVEVASAAAGPGLTATTTGMEEGSGIVMVTELTVLARIEGLCPMEAEVVPVTGGNPAGVGDASSSPQQATSSRVPLAPNIGQEVDTAHSEAGVVAAERWGVAYLHSVIHLLMLIRPTREARWPR